MNRFVYLDNNATTKLSERVKEKIKPYLNLQFGNPSNLYNFGKQVKQELKVEIYGMVMVIQLQQGRKNLSLILI